MLLVMASSSVCAFGCCFDHYFPNFNWKLTERSGSIIIVMSLLAFYSTLFLHVDRAKIKNCKNVISFIDQDEYPSTPAVPTGETRTKANLECVATLQRAMLDETLRKLTSYEIALAGIGTLIWGFAGINEYTAIFFGLCALLTLLISCIWLVIADITPGERIVAKTNHQLREKDYARVGAFVCSVFASSPCFANVFFSS